MPEPKARPMSGFEERMGDVGAKVMSRLNGWLFRVSRGRLGGTFLYGAPVMLVTTVGRKTGQPRTTPLLYLRDGDALVTVASKGGSARDPGWYRNLTAEPKVEVE